MSIHKSSWRCKKNIWSYALIFLISWPPWLSCMRVRLVNRRLWVQSTMGQQQPFVKIDHEIFSTVILSLLLIQEGQLSVSGKRMCTMLVNRNED